MKIPSNNIESFVAKMPAGVKAVLLYGPDYGLISQRASTLSAQIVADINDPFSVHKLDYDQLDSNPHLLAEAALGLSFNMQRKLVKIVDANNSISKALQQVLETAILGNNAFILVIAKDLPTSSSLRKYFENSENIAAIQCYKDDGLILRNVIINHLNKNNYTYEDEVVSFLEYNMRGDRLLIISELDKLITYMSDNRHITLEDAQFLASDNNDFSLDDLCQLLANSNLPAAYTLFNNMLADGTNQIAIIRGLMRYFGRLHQTKSFIASGIAETEALAKLSPPIFFKYKPSFTVHLRKLSLARLTDIMTKLIELELACKQTGAPMTLLCEKVISELV
jgi:DNA polymerase-3 subunit delta